MTTNVFVGNIPYNYEKEDLKKTLSLVGPVKLLEIKKDDFQSIIQELSAPTENDFPPEDYPLYKYFMLTKYSTKEEFIKKLGPPNIYGLKYPLLRQYLLENPDIYKMKYLTQ